MTQLLNYFCSHVPDCIGASQNNEGTIRLDFEGSCRAVTASELLSAYKYIAIQAVNIERKRRETLGVAVTFPDGPGIIQTRDAEDFRNINAQATYATILRATGETRPVIWFIDADNVRHYMTPDQMLNIALQVQQAIAALVDKGRTAKEAIDALNDIDSLQTFDVAAAFD